MSETPPSGEEEQSAPGAAPGGRESWPPPSYPPPPPPPAGSPPPWGQPVAEPPPPPPPYGQPGTEPPRYPGPSQQPGYGAPPYGSAPYGAPGYGAAPPAQGQWGDPYQYGATPAGPVLAGWWRRFWGALIDGVVVGIVAFILVAAFRHHEAIAVGLGEVFQLAYLVGMIGSRGQTLGMMAVRVQLHDANTGSTAIGYPKALLRALTAIVLGLPLALGLALGGILPLLDYLWPLWDKRNQTLHDKVAGTVAVKM